MDLSHGNTMALKLWKNLSDDIKLSTSYVAFKRMLLDIDIQLEF